MKTMTSLLFGLLITFSAAPSVYADLKDDVAAAAKKLADQKSYQWRTTVRAEGGGPFGGNSSTSGQTDNDGYLWVSSTSPQARSEFAARPTRPPSSSTATG